MLLLAHAGYSDKPRLHSWLSLQPTLKVLGARWKVGGEQDGERRCVAPEGDGVPVLEVVGEVPVLPPEKHSQQTFRNIQTPKTHCGYTFLYMKNKYTLKRRTVRQSQL